PLHVRSPGGRGGGANAAAGWFPGQTAHAGIRKLLGRRAPRQDATLLYGPRYRVRRIRRVGPAVRDGPLAAPAIFEPEIRRAAAGAIRRSRPAEALRYLEANEPDTGRRRAQSLHVDPHADYRRAQQRRHQDRIFRRNVAAVRKDAMTRPPITRWYY